MSYQRDHAAHARCAVIERLEPRQLLCGYHGVPQPALEPEVAALVTRAAASKPSAAVKAALGGSWSAGPQSPIAAGEVAAGVIGNTLYVFSQATTATLTYNLSTGKWSSTAVPKRPVHGDHHAAEVVNGKLYLVGGLTEYRGTTEPAGKVQVYDPKTNKWRFAAPMPWKGGSVSTVVMNGRIFAAGGIINSKPGQHAGTGSTTMHARYNPALNKWTIMPPMPKAANHAASASDGRHFYVFGGRGGRNVLANGFATVQRYDRFEKRWVSSDTSPAVKPMPVGRGGMGDAVFHNGEFYVFGGETLNGTGATANRVFSRVDIYRPSTNTWRQGTPLPTAVHGSYPVKWSDKIYLPGGGTFAGFSQSKLLQIYTPG